MVFNFELFKNADLLNHGIESIIADIHNYLLQAYQTNPIQPTKSIVDVFEDAIPSQIADNQQISRSLDKDWVKDWLDQKRVLDAEKLAENSSDWVLKKLYEFRQCLIDLSCCMYFKKHLLLAELLLKMKSSKDLLMRFLDIFWIFKRKQLLAIMKICIML
jgi:hypothetical protein